MRDLLKKLSTWREESLQHLSNLVSYGNSINKAIEELIEEVCDLKDQLFISTKDRNELIETVNDLKCENRHLDDKLSVTKPTLFANNQLKEEVDEPKNVERHKINREGDDQEDQYYESNRRNIFNESPSKYWLTMDFTNGAPETSYNEETEDIVDGTDRDRNLVYSEDHSCPKCHFPFSTSENLYIHLKNAHSVMEENVKQRKPGYQNSEGGLDRGGG